MAKPPLRYPQARPTKRGRMPITARTAFVSSIASIGVGGRVRRCRSTGYARRTMPDGTLRRIAISAADRGRLRFPDQGVVLSVEKYYTLLTASPDIDAIHRDKQAPRGPVRFVLRPLARAFSARRPRFRIPESNSPAPTCTTHCPARGRNRATRGAGSRRVRRSREGKSNNRRTVVVSDAGSSHHPTAICPVLRFDDAVAT